MAHVVTLYKRRGMVPVNIRIEYDVVDGKPTNLRFSVPEHAEYLIPADDLPALIARVDRNYAAEVRAADPNRVREPDTPPPENRLRGAFGAEREA